MSLWLLDAHVEALFTLSAAKRLVRVNEPGGGPAPRFFLGQTSQGKRWWPGADLPDHVIDAIAREVNEVPSHMETDGPGTSLPAVDALLAGLAPIARCWRGPAFRFPDQLPRSQAVRITAENAHLLDPLMAAWSGDIVSSAPLVAAVVGGRAVSVCASVRRTSAAHEAGVETAEPFRGQGYGAQAVTAWATAVAMMNRVPLYSTSWENSASRALARRLKLIQFASDYHVT